MHLSDDGQHQHLLEIATELARNVREMFGQKFHEMILVGGVILPEAKLNLIGHQRVGFRWQGRLHVRFGPNQASA